MSLQRCLATVALASLASIAAWSTSFAQEEFPSEAVTLIVPWPAGGGSDTSMRLLAEAAEEHLGQPIVVVNRPGAGGAEGTRVIASAEADGYTIGMVGSGVIARHYTNPNANAYTDLQPIAFFGADPGALTANPETGFEDVDDFVQAARENPGGIKNGNDQPGGSSYITAAVIEGALDVELRKIPYQGFAPTTAALLAGEVDTATVPVPDVIEHHNADRLRILGVTDTKRHFLAPDVPTFQEQGHDVVIGSWRAIVGPQGIPEDRLKVLEDALLATLSDEAFVERANAAGFGINPMNAEETAAFLKQYDDTLYPVLKDANLVQARERDQQ